MNTKVLTFEINKDKDQIEVFFNKEGYLYLMEVLGEIDINGNDSDHCHLMTDSWGGEGLSNEVMHKGNQLINHIKMIYINESE